MYVVHLQPHQHMLHPLPHIPGHILLFWGHSKVTLKRLNFLVPPGEEGMKGEDGEEGMEGEDGDDRWMEVVPRLT